MANLSFPLTTRATKRKKTCFFTQINKRHPNLLTFFVEMHCHKMHDGMLHKHLSQLEPINQQSFSQPTNQQINPNNHQQIHRMMYRTKCSNFKTSTII